MWTVTKSQTRRRDYEPRPFRITESLFVTGATRKRKGQSVFQTMSPFRGSTNGRRGAPLCERPAQETTGAISGTVKDPSGAVVPNAQVTLRDTEKNADVRTMTTSATGEFSFPQLPVGRYSFTVEATGFRKFVQAGIVLNVNDKLTFFPSLEVGGTSKW